MRGTRKDPGSPAPPNATKIGNMSMKVARLPTDNIGSGAASPLFTPHVKRVLEARGGVHH